VDEFLENIMKIGGILAVVCLPLAFMMMIVGGPEGGTLGLIIGLVGLVVYFIASAVLEKNS
jgi:hypothetical protein